MKFFFFTFFILSVSFALPAAGKSKTVIVSISKETILADLDEYASNIAKLHVDPFSIFPKDSFYNGIAALKANAPLWDADQMLAQWMILNARLQDEHMRIFYTGRDVFPFDCYWFSEGIYITRTTENNMQYLWSKITAVNHIPIADVAKKIRQLLPDTNAAALKYFLPQYIFDPFVIHGLGIAPSRKDITYTVTTQNGKTIELHPQAEDRRTLQLHKGFDSKHLLRYEKNLPYWHEYVSAGNYIYFQYNTCRSNKKQPFSKEEKALLKAIDKCQPQRIIIDLRNNGGGYPHMIGHVIDYIKRSKLNRPGGIYVLTGRRTFSAAVINSIQLRHETYARIVGEGTSGSTAFYGSVETFRLPNTHLDVMYANDYWVSEEKYDGSLRPDVLIPETFEDYSHEKDAALEFAIKGQ